MNLDEKNIRALVRARMPAVYEMLHNLGPAATLILVRCRYRLRIAEGPFRGMRYIPHSTGSSLLPKLVGSYEAELHGILRGIVGAHYDAFMDIGCAEGYYAVGLAKMFPGTPVYAYDIDPHARALCSRLAALNAVSDQVRVLGECTRGELESRRGRRLLVLCDCEGAEADIFDAGVAAFLYNSDVLIELHEQFRPGTTEKLLAAFRRTHAAQMIPANLANDRDLASVRNLPRMLRKFAVWENRQIVQAWLWLRPMARRKIGGQD